MMTKTDHDLRHLASMTKSEVDLVAAAAGSRETRAIVTNQRIPGWLLFAAASLVSTSCSKKSSPKPETETQATPTAPSSDAGVADAAQATPSAAACVPSGATLDLVASPGAAALCWTDDKDAPACVRVEESGTVSRVASAAPAAASAFPSAAVVDEAGKDVDLAEGGGSQVKVCSATDQCKSVKPKVPKEAVRGAAVAPDGKTVAVLLQDDPMEAGRVALLDVGTGKQLDLIKTEWNDHHGVSYSVAFAGPLLVWTELPGATNSAHAALYRLDKGKLRSAGTVNGNAYSQVATGSRALFVGNELSAEVHELATGKHLATLDLGGLVKEAEQADWQEEKESGNSPLAAAAGDSVVFAIVTPKATRAAFAKPDSAGAPRYVDVPVCAPAATK